MAVTNLNTIKSWFYKGAVPPHTQFWAWLDSFWHKDEMIPAAKVQGMDALLSGKAEKSVVDGHINLEDNHRAHNHNNIIINNSIEILHGYEFPTQANFNAEVDAIILNLKSRIEELEKPGT